VSGKKTSPIELCERQRPVSAWPYPTYLSPPSSFSLSLKLKFCYIHILSACLALLFNIFSLYSIRSKLIIFEEKEEEKAAAKRINK